MINFQLFSIQPYNIINNRNDLLKKLLKKGESRKVARSCKEQSVLIHFQLFSIQPYNIIDNRNDLLKK